jgi:hypothetical protein
MCCWETVKSGPHRGWRNAIDGDVLLGQFLQRLGQTDDRCLRRCKLTRWDSLPARNGSDVDDAAVAVLLQMRHNFTAGVEHTMQIDVVHPYPLLDRYSHQGVGACNTCEFTSASILPNVAAVSLAAVAPADS